MTQFDTIQGGRRRFDKRTRRAGRVSVVLAVGALLSAAIGLGGA